MAQGSKSKDKIFLPVANFVFGKHIESQARVFENRTFGMLVGILAIFIKSFYLSENFKQSIFLRNRSPRNDVSDFNLNFSHSKSAFPGEAIEESIFT
jgi:hypothetical protein